MQIRTMPQPVPSTTQRVATGSHGLPRALAEYGGALILCLLILVWVMRLWETDLRKPFCYWGDGLITQAFIKTGMDNRWYWHNHQLSMPATFELTDFPAEVSASFLFLQVKLLSLALADSALVMNVFYLLGFPLITMSALLVLRRLRMSYPSALVAALLYTFLPYHFFRGEPHLFLAMYFLVPFSVLLALWVYQEEPIFFRWDPVRRNMRPSLRGGRSWAGLGLGVLLGCAQIYYAFFTCYLLLVAGISSSLCRRKLYPLGSALLLAGIIGCVSLVNLAPTLAYWRTYGQNPALQRSPAEAEIFGMKIIQFLLPIDGHRLPVFRSMRERYDQSAPLVNENKGAALGCVASVGFLLLVGRLFYRKPGAWQPKLMDQLAMLNMGAVLLGTIGGFGALVAFLGSPWIRGYNRISIFVAFLALAAVGLLLDKLFRRYGKSKGWRIALCGAWALLLALGVLDQTCPADVPLYAAIKPMVEIDAEFVSAMEGSVPPGAMIFQLPYVCFPNDQHPHAMRTYDHFRGYLHSKALRWSYPAMGGREADAWQRTVAASPPEEMVRRLSEAGFRGIYINRDGFPDRACALETALKRITGHEPIESSHRQLSFFRLQE